VGLHGGVPETLVLALRDAFGIDRFLETGTHLGGTAAWAADVFGQVVTIEASEELHRQATARLGHLLNVRFVLGDTRAELAGEIERLGGPAIVWLDSHWSGGGTYGEGDECPLLREIEILRASRHEHHLLVDDARLFLAPPPRPHRAEQWPTLAEVVAALTSGDRPLEVLVLDDVLVAVPLAAKPLVWRHAQDAATRAWKRHTAGEARDHRTATARARGLVARLRNRA
jgi:hypothetical protein